MKNKPSPANWSQLLSFALSAGPDEIPPGYKSATEISKETGLSETTLRRKLPILEAEGKLSKDYFRCVAQDGRVMKKPFWKMKE